MRRATSRFAAFMFSVYGLPSGDSELPVDRNSLRTIAIARPCSASYDTGELKTGRLR